MRSEAGRIGREAKGDDQVARLQGGLLLRRVSGQSVKVFERNLAPARPAFDLDDSIERGERHTEVGRMRRDAMLAPTENRLQAILAMERVAAGARLTPVARTRGVVEIAAAGALHQVAADRRGVAKLSRGAGQERFGDGRIGPGEIRVVGEVGIADERADAGAAVGKPFDAVEARKTHDVDEALRPDGAALHQVEQIGARGEIGGARFDRRRDRLRNRRWSHKVEAVHAALLRSCFARVFCASTTASVIP